MNLWRKCEKADKKDRFSAIFFAGSAFCIYDSCLASGSVCSLKNPDILNASGFLEKLPFADVDSVVADARFCRQCGFIYQASAEASGQIVLSAFVLRMGKDFSGIAELHHFTYKEERQVVRNAGCLLHIVGDDDHGVFLF